MSEELTLSPSDYLEAIVGVLETKFNGKVASVTTEIPVEEGAIKTPALVVEIGSVGDGIDGGDDRIPLDFTVNIFCILGYSTHSPENNIHIEREIVNMACAVKAKIRHERWGFGSAASIIRSINAEPIESVKASNCLKGYEKWLVSFDQTFYASDDMWATTGSEITTVYSNNNDNTELLVEP